MRSRCPEGPFSARRRSHAHTGSECGLVVAESQLIETDGKVSLMKCLAEKVGADAL
ncbi:MAG: hypothetical protein ACLSGS_02300 [Adlercreutzia sp.]